MFIIGGYTHHEFGDFNWYFLYVGETNDFIGYVGVEFIDCVTLFHWCDGGKEKLLVMVLVPAW